MFDIIKCILTCIKKKQEDEDDRADPKPNPDVPENPPVEKPKERLLEIPWAIQLPKIKTQGKYRFGYAESSTIHFNAGHHNPYNLHAYLKSKNYPVIIIDREGKTYQTMPLDEWGWHAGKSSHVSQGYDVNSMNKYSLPFEVLSAGGVKKLKAGTKVISNGKLEKLVTEKFAPWFALQNNKKKPFYKHYRKSRLINSSEVRYSPGEENILKGYYEKFTPIQETELIRTLVWLYKNDTKNVFKIENIIGHDECRNEWKKNHPTVRISAKNDPGAALSMTMNELRDEVRNKIGE